MVRACALDGENEPGSGADMVDHLLVIWTAEDFLKLMQDSTQPGMTIEGDFPFLEQGRAIRATCVVGYRDTRGLIFSDTALSVHACDSHQEYP